MPHGSPGMTSKISSSLRRADLLRSERQRDPVEHGVDVFVALLRAESFRQLHRLVQHDAIGNLGMKLQLESAQAQNRALHRIDLGDATINVRREMLVEAGDVRRYLADQVLKVVEIGVLERIVRE